MHHENNKDLVNKLTTDWATRTAQIELDPKCSNIDTRDFNRAVTVAIIKQFAHAWIPRMVSFERSQRQCLNIASSSIFRQWNSIRGLVCTSVSQTLKNQIRGHKILLEGLTEFWLRF